MKKTYLLIFLFFYVFGFSQVRGIVTETNGNPISSVLVTLENTSNTAISAEDGNYFLNIQNVGDYTLIFKCMGYKTKKLKISISKLPHSLNVKMEEEHYNLKEVVINVGENPANSIIRNAIKHRKDNTDKILSYTADFYSKEIMKVKVPAGIKKIKISNYDGPYHDTVTNGIVYLSETISKLTFEKPDKLKEQIVASKVSGKRDDYSATLASNWDFDFYSNTVKFHKLVSPIASDAFRYYKYKIEGTFIDENGLMINKIKVLPKDEKGLVFHGYIYIVEDSWAIYGVDLNTNGIRVNTSYLTDFNIQQSFSYNKSYRFWTKSSQVIEYNTRTGKNTLNDKETFLYKNYDFVDAFDKDTFSNQIASFDDNSNKKDLSYWEENRPILLTNEEQKNYKMMDSIIAVQDSIKKQPGAERAGLTKVGLNAQEKNKFRWYKVLTGYHYSDELNDVGFSYFGLTSTNLILSSFNTVQGWESSSGFYYKKKDESRGAETTIQNYYNYGFSEDRLRINGIFTHQFDKKNYNVIDISGGTIVEQFNSNKPISKFVNTLSSLFFEDNFMKLYNKEFAGVKYSRFVLNGTVNFLMNMEYSQRRALYNNTNLVWVKHNDNYTSNNPLSPNDYVSQPFDTHHLTKASLSSMINFGSRYVARPDKNIFLSTNKYPIIYLDYTNAFLASNKKYNYQFFSAKVDYIKGFENHGDWTISLGAGKFIHGKEISFVDYKHFNGNQTHVGGAGRYMDVFNFMPYYTNSTNDSYIELHTEYNDGGYLIGTIPGLKLLRCSLVFGFHDLAVPNNKPYTEYTVGLNNFGNKILKNFRFDYIRSYQNGFVADGMVIGYRILSNSKFLQAKL